MATGSVKRLGGHVQQIASGTHSASGIDYFIDANETCCICSILREADGTAVTGWVNIGAIPDGYRPLSNYTSYFEHANGSVARMRVTSNGNIQVWGIPKGQIGGSITYPI